MSAKAFDMILAVPKYGRVKANKILTQCRISPRRRSAASPSASAANSWASCAGRASLRKTAAPKAAGRPGVSRADARTPRCAPTMPSLGGAAVSSSGFTRRWVLCVSQDWRCGEGVRDHRAVGGREGDPDPRAAPARSRARAVGVRDHPAAAGRRGRRARLPLPRAARSSTAAPTRASSSSTPPTAATGTGRCAPRSSGGSPRARRSSSRSRCRARGRCGRRWPESVLVFIAPPTPASLRKRLVGRGTDSADQIDERLRTAEIELAAQEEFPHVVVNDEVERAASTAGRDRARRAGPRPLN